MKGSVRALVTSLLDEVRADNSVRPDYRRAMRSDRQTGHRLEEGEEFEPNLGEEFPLRASPNTPKWFGALWAEVGAEVEDMLTELREGRTETEWTTSSDWQSSSAAMSKSNGSVTS